MYNIGYFNKPWNKSDFVILAQTKSKSVATFIMDSYNDSYKRVGLSARAVIVPNECLPEDHRFATDLV